MSFSQGYQLPFNSISGPDPLADTGQRVHPTQAITPPDPIRFVPIKSYVCTMPNASFHRRDGTRIGFRMGFLETDVEATQQYLDNEILSGNSYVREATEAEIYNAKMAIDPRGTLEKQLRGEIELELRVQLEAEIRAKLGIVTSAPSPSEDLPAMGSEEDVQRSNADANKIAGAAPLREKLAALGVTTSRSGNGSKVIMRSEPAPLQGIVNSANISEGAAG